MDWTQDKTAARRTFVMDIDPRYMVESWGIGSWQVWFDGYRISPDDASLGSREVAQKFAEEHRDSPGQRIERAQLIISLYGRTAGDRHRAWVIRAIQSVLVGREPDYTDPDKP